MAHANWPTVAIMTSTALAALLVNPAAASESSALPGEWRFTIDHADEGLDARWFDPSFADAGWSTVSTHRWKGWVEQGLPPHAGFAWYRVAHPVPQSMAGKHVHLYFGGVGDAAWVWVNGQAVGEHALRRALEGPSWVRPFQLDITSAVRPGEINRIAVRVQNVEGSVAGIWQPVYVFAADGPLTLGQMGERTQGLNRQILAALDPVVRFDVWATYAYLPTAPDDAPPSGEPSIVKEQDNGSRARSFTEAVRLRGASGEFVPMAVHVRNHGDRPIAVRLDFLPVRHEKLDLLLTMDRVEVRSVDYILTRRRDLVPDPLPRLGSSNGLRIAPRETETFFVLIDTRGMPAGVWQGHLHLTPLRAGPFLDIPFRLEVAPVALPERMPIWLNMWSNAPGGTWMPDGRGDNEAYLSLMRRTGVNVVQSHAKPTAILNDAGDIVGIDTERFDRMLARHGFDERSQLVLGHMLGGVGSMEEHFARPSDPDRWQRNLPLYFRMLSGHVRENHRIPYDRWSVYLLDENIGPHFLTLARLVRAGDPKIRIWANRTEDLETMQKAAPYIDVFAPYAPWLAPEGRGHGKYAESERLMDEKGVPWWPYFHAWWQGSEKTAFPRALPSAPHDMLRMHAWFAWKLDLEGFGYWVFAMENYIRRYSGFPSVGVKLLHLPYTNVGFIYLGHDGPIPSRRLEAYRDGWEDYKLLWTIEQAAAVDGQDPARADGARANVSSAVDAILADRGDIDLLLRWRDTLLDDAGALCAAAPLDVAVDAVDTTRHGIRVRCSASRPVRVWTWVDRGRHDRGYVEPAGASDAPVIAIDDLVPGETCRLTLVFAGPEGQQRVLTREVATQGWE